MWRAVGFIEMCFIWLNAGKKVRRRTVVLAKLEVH